MAKRWSRSKLKSAAQELKKQGRTGDDGVTDSDIVHVNSREKSMLKRYGGAGTTNPKTGLKEYKSTAELARGSFEKAYNSSPGKGTASGSGSDTAKPPQSTGPTPADDTLGMSPESAAVALGSGGSQPLGDAGSASAPSKNLPKGVTPMNKKAPLGADQFIGDPSVGQVLGTAVSALAPGGAINSLGDVETDENGKIKGNADTPTKGGFVGKGLDAVFGDTPGKQTGWSASRNHGVPGDIGGSGGAQGTKKESQTADADTKSGAKATSDSTGSAAAAVAGNSGGTVTVNPDGTIRTTDTSVAGLRAKKRYGATAKPKAA